MASESDWNANLYDEKHSFVWKMAAGLLELLDAKAGERILDLGCGTGHMTAQIAASGASVIGIDRSPDMIDRAQQAHPGIRFEVMDALELAFAEPFDAVFSNATLHWIKDPQPVIAGIARILRPGGRFVAEFGGKGNIAGIVAAGERAWAALRLPGAFPDPWYYPSVAEYAGRLESHGLDVTYALLFARPTTLEDGERGLRNWLEMFAGSITAQLPEPRRAEFLAEVERQARPHLYRDGSWVADYRRLRLVAAKR